ncbi:hypothetical protein [Microbacterium barkeri]|uniref:hypothetical protein n=1 Tax=Microbacterium barkeri TaxID=33917 RepID=UPI00285824E1|nr:hypothetical protein [Microbacterium barkeri]MDR6876122.1 type VI protein secretion system component VasF [Microbacterium barkeri]
MALPDRIGPRDEDARRAVFAFDQAVDALAEESAFLSVGPDRQAARYLADAHRTLDGVRTSMHRIAARASDTGLRKGARRRLQALAADLAQAGLRDAEHARAAAQRLRAAAVAPTGGWGATLRHQTARATAWGVEKWTGSPLAPVELRSTKAAALAESSADAIAQRGRAPARSRVRTWLIVAGSAAAAAVIGGASLAVYGAWSLIGLLFGAG